jgi:hypothetical protein
LFEARELGIVHVLADLAVKLCQNEIRTILLEFLVRGVVGSWAACSDTAPATPA